MFSHASNGYPIRNVLNIKIFIILHNKRSSIGGPRVGQWHKSKMPANTQALSSLCRTTYSLAFILSLVLSWVQVRCFGCSPCAKSPSHSPVLKEVKEMSLHTSIIIQLFSQNFTSCPTAWDWVMRPCQPAGDAGKGSPISYFQSLSWEVCSATKKGGRVGQVAREQAINRPYHTR